MTLEEWRRSQSLTYRQLGDGLDIVEASAWKLCNKPQRAYAPGLVARIFALTAGAIDANALYGLTPEPGMGDVLGRARAAGM